MLAAGRDDLVCGRWNRVDQRLGPLLMLLAVLSFLFLPWLDRSPVRSIRYKSRLSRFFLVMFAIAGS